MLFKKIEFWVLGLVFICAILGAILFGAVVLDEERGDAELGGDHFGLFGDMALSLAEMPENARQALKTLGGTDQTMVAWLAIQSDLASGWSWTQPPGSGGLAGFLLLSRYDGTQSRHVIELVSMTTGKSMHRWEPEPETLLSAISRRPEFEGIAEFERWKNAYFRFIHPYLTESGELLLKDHQSPLFMLSVCGNVRWSQDEHLFHHSTEADGTGGFWIPSYVLQTKPGVSQKFLEDALARVTADGKVSYKKSLIEIFNENGLRHLMFPAANFYKDPIHLNDIEPVLESGPYWEKGDLFLSFRSPSLVALFRPSTGEIIWSQSGPWQSQHDVDIIDDHRIAVFNNNAYDSGLGARVDGVSETVVYDFETNSVTSPFREALERFNTATVSEGLQEFTPSGHLIFEEENRGRLFIFDASGNVVATFTNRVDGGELYRMGWSRYMSQSQGEEALKAIADGDC